MNTLPDQVKQIIYEYDNTYHAIYDGVMDELVNKTFINARVYHNGYVADLIKINGIRLIVHQHVWNYGLGLILNS